MSKRGWHEKKTLRLRNGRVVAKRHHRVAKKKVHYPSYPRDLSVYVTDKPIYRKPKRGTRLAKRIPRLGSPYDDEAPVAKSHMVYMLKQYPWLEKRIRKEKPDKVVYSSRTSDLDKDKGAEVEGWVEFDLKTREKEIWLRPPHIRKSEDFVAKDARALGLNEREVNSLVKATPLSTDSEEAMMEKMIKSNVANLDHELEHLKYVRKRGFERSMEELDREEKTPYIEKRSERKIHKKTTKLREKL